MGDLPQLTARMARIQPFHVMDLLARARTLESEGRDLVHMEVGEPDFGTPEPVVLAAQRVLQCDFTQCHGTKRIQLDQSRPAL